MTRHDEILAGIYHKGQEKIWDGRDTLRSLVNHHGGVIDLDQHVKHSLGRILTMILRGEEAAWQISLQLGTMLDSIPARMAATSQAHDEARHFYVMQDYLKLCGCGEVPLPYSVNEALKMVQGTTSLAKKLLGMQLMVEPIALTIFQEIRRIQAEPVLSDLLVYYERDEARHVALGVHHLPVVMNDLSTFSLVGLTTWQFRLFMLELEGLKELRKDFETIGLCVEKLFTLAERKQLDALKEVATQLGWAPAVWKPLQNVLRYQKTRILGTK